MNKYMKQFIGGVASVLAVFPVANTVQVSVATSSNRSDADALRSDVKRLGGDFNRATDRVMRDQKQG